MPSSPDATLLEFLRAHGLTAPTEDGTFVVLDLRELGPTMGDYNEGLIEALRNVEVLTVANTTLRTLDLSGFAQLRELRIGAANRGIQLNVSECERLSSITVLPYDPNSGDVHETLVVCRLDQLDRQSAQSMETERKTSDGLLTVRFESVDGSLSGVEGIHQVCGEMLGWLSRHACMDLATILASYWHEAPWFWAQYDDEDDLRLAEQVIYRRMRDIEARVGSGFYVSQVHSFDLRDDTWKYTERDKDPAAVLKREIPPWMFAAPYSANPPDGDT